MVGQASQKAKDILAGINADPGVPAPDKSLIKEKALEQMMRRNENIVD